MSLGEESPHHSQDKLHGEGKSQLAGKWLGGESQGGRVVPAPSKVAAMPRQMVSWQPWVWKQR